MIITLVPTPVGTNSVPCLQVARWRVRFVRLQLGGCRTRGPQKCSWMLIQQAECRGVKGASLHNGRTCVHSGVVAGLSEPASADGGRRAPDVFGRRQYDTVNAHGRARGNSRIRGDGIHGGPLAPAPRSFFVLKILLRRMRAKGNVGTSLLLPDEAFGRRQCSTTLVDGRSRDNSGARAEQHARRPRSRSRQDSLLSQKIGWVKHGQRGMSRQVCPPSPG